MIVTSPHSDTVIVTIYPSSLLSLLTLTQCSLTGQLSPLDSQSNTWKKIFKRIFHIVHQKSLPNGIRCLSPQSTPFPPQLTTSCGLCTGVTGALYRGTDSPSPRMTMRPAWPSEQPRTGSESSDGPSRSSPSTSPGRTSTAWSPPP